MRLMVLVILASLHIWSCSSGDSRKTIQFLHFWTEPAQQKIIDSLIQKFEKTYPTIHVEQIPVQWSEGRTKLLLAHSSQTPPDITHIGIEWAQEFIDAKIFDPVKTGIDFPIQCKEHIMGSDGRSYCIPWTMNTRSLIAVNTAVEIDSDELSIEQLLNNLDSGYVFGLNATEPHNVTKKYLPIIWAGGSTLFTKLPFSMTCDEELPRALSMLKRILKHARIEKSRILDEQLVQGKIQYAITGQWILPQLSNVRHRVIPRIPGGKGESILSGDCLGIAQRSKYKKEALLFAEYLTDYEHVKVMCMQLSDIGIPANNRSWSDVDFRRTSDIANFTEQTQHSRILPSPSYYLDAEQMLEEHIMSFVYGKTDAEACAKSLKKALIELENKQKKGS